MHNDLPVYDHHRGEGPTLVLLHYWGGSARTWNGVADRLPGRDLLRPDFRGWRRSAELEGPYSLQQYAQDVTAVLREASVSEFVLVGHSMGGKVAQLIAADRPAGLRGLVLVGSGPAVPPAEITAEYQEQLSHAYDSVESVEFARDNILTATALPVALRTQVLADSRSGRPPATQQWPLHGIAEDISDRTRRIEAPTLVIAGEHDVVEPAAVLRSNLLPHLRRADFLVIRGTGHLIPLEAPGELADVLDDFVRGLDDGLVA